MLLTAARKTPTGFTTTQNLDELEFSPKWAVDSTISVCTSSSYQLKAMLGIIKDTTVPLVYCLMRTKTKKSTKNCLQH